MQSMYLLYLLNTEINKDRVEQSFSAVFLSCIDFFIYPCRLENFASDKETASAAPPNYSQQ